MIPIASNWGALPPETEEDRRRAASIGIETIYEAQEFVARMRDLIIGTAYDLDGEEVNTNGDEARRYWDGKKWNEAEASYRGVGDVKVKSVNEAMVQHMIGPLTRKDEPFPGNLRGNISTFVQRLAFGESKIDEWYTDMRRAVKFGDMAATSLAWGGWKNTPDEAFRRSEERVFIQYNGNGGRIQGLRKFGEDIVRGRYGDTVLDQNAWNRAGLYGNAPRQVYENEHVTARKELAGHTLACRLLAAVEHCRDCIRWAADGFIPIEIMMSQRAMGMADCGYGDHCRIVTKRASGVIAPSVARAIERARGMAADVELIGVGRLTA